MNNIALFYFSGTGNTENVSELFKEYFTSYRVDLIRIENILNNVSQVDMAKYEIIGIGFPSYGFNAPKIVDDFVKQLKTVSNKKCFLFLTCAGPCYLNDVAFFGIKRILVRKNYEIIYEKVICMPSNIGLRYDKELLKRIFDAEEKIVRRMTSDISNKIINIRNDRFLPYMFRWLLYLVDRIGLKTVPLDFYAGKECNQCLKCVQICPRHNISLMDKNIKFGLNCEACYRCVYSCPQKAIKGRLYSLAIFKEGYSIRQKINDCTNVEIKTPLKGIYKTMTTYFKSAE
jgi:ferredoxin